MSKVKHLNDDACAAAEAAVRDGVGVDKIAQALGLEADVVKDWFAYGQAQSLRANNRHSDTQRACYRLWRAQADAVIADVAAGVKRLRALIADDDAPPSVSLRAAIFMLERRLPESYHANIGVVDAFEVMRDALDGAIADKAQSEAAQAELRALLERRGVM